MQQAQLIADDDPRTIKQILLDHGFTTSKPTDPRAHYCKDIVDASGAVVATLSAGAVVPWLNERLNAAPVQP